MRQAIVRHLERYEEKYKDFVHGQKYSEFLVEMSKDGVWGNHLTLKAFADATHTQINLITSYAEDGVKEVKPWVLESEREYWLSFWAEVHYNSLEAQPEFQGINSYVDV